MNPASERILHHFLNHNLPPDLKDIAERIYNLAHDLAVELDSNNPEAGAEVTVGLRKLREAKDNLVLAKVILKEGD